MTINSTIRKAGPFIGNGTASSFPFTYKVFQASDLDVVRLDQSTNVETTLVLTTDYTVTLNQDQDSNPGGTVTLVAGALATGYTLTMTSDVPNLQPTDLTNQGGFYPEVINDALDRATIQIQQLQEQTDRSLRLPLSSTADAELPPSAPNELIGWDATGNNLINVDPGSLASVAAYATAYCDVFVGNGITTSWTLTRNPAVLYNLDVSINGSTQEPTRDYTLSGTTFTMTTPPPIGARVVVKYKEGLPNYSGDSQDVRYLPAGTGALPSNVQDVLRRTIYVEDFGADPTGVADSYSAIQAALNYAIPLSLNIIGTGKYKTSQQIIIPQYRTTPPVTLDFVVLNFTINQLTYTGTTGAAIQVSSPAVSVYVKKLIGPGGSTSTSGLTIIGQGDPEHRVDYVTGFGVNVNVLNAYSHTVWVGYCQDAGVGVLMTDSNHIKLYGGRIGGQFTPGNIATDPSTCLIGVKIMGGIANEVHGTIEYCKRDVGAVGLYDNGNSTYYLGYLEGSAAYNLYAIGRGGRYYSVTGTNRGPSGVYLENDNQFFLTGQSVLEQVTPAGNNTTLTFDTPSKFETEGFAKITGVQGYTEQQITALADVRNEILYSADLTNAAWTKSTVGSANWGAVTIDNTQPGFVEAGYGASTRFVFPGLPADNDIYRIGQANRITRVGPLNYGIWIWVESGDIDVQVRILEAANNVQSKQVVRLGASNKWVNVAARYMKTTPYANDVLFELQFRTTTGATVRVANTYLITESDVFFAPLNVDNVLKKNIKGVPVDGDCFEQGIRINGAIQNQIAPAISSAGQYLLSKGNYPVYVVTGGWTGNLFLEDSGYEGQRVIIKRDGVAATGTMQLIPVSTIDGTNTPINIATAYTTLEVIWSTVAGGWLQLR